MHLLYILSDPGIPIGSARGSAVHVRCLLGALARAGHRVDLLVRRNEGPEPLPEGVEVLVPQEEPAGCGEPEAIATGVRGGGSALPREIETLRYNDRMARMVTPMVVQMPPDALIERLSLFGTAGLEIAHRLGVPFLLEVNAPLVEETRRWRRIGLDEHATGVESRLLREADAVLAVSEPLLAWAVGRGAAVDRVHLLENGVDQVLFSPQGTAAPLRQERGIGARFLVGFAGSLKPWHGVDVLIEAVASMARRGREAHLLAVGEGPQEKALRARAAELGIGERIHWLGARRHAEVPALLRSCDVLAAPYPALQSFYFSPLKVLEYLALGRPVVASAIGPIPDWIRDGQDGLLTPPGDPAALAEALERIQEKRALAARLAAAAPSRVAHRTWRHVAERLIAVAGECRLRRGAAAPAASREAS